MKVSITKHERVDIDTETMKEVTLETLRKVYDIPEGGFIENNNLVVWNDRHASGWNDVIRKATDEDEMILEIMKRVKK